MQYPLTDNDQDFVIAKMKEGYSEDDAIAMLNERQDEIIKDYAKGEYELN